MTPKSLLCWDDDADKYDDGNDGDDDDDDGDDDDDSMILIYISR